MPGNPRVLGLKRKPLGGWSFLQQPHPNSLLARTPPLPSQGANLSPQIKEEPRFLHKEAGCVCVHTHTHSHADKHVHSSPTSPFCPRVSLLGSIAGGPILPTCPHVFVQTLCRSGETTVLEVPVPCHPEGKVHITQTRAKGWAGNYEQHL